MPPKYTDAQRIAAFWSKVEVKGPDVCWPWKGARQSTGYGRFNWDGHNRLAHRIAFFLSGGYLPENLIICHTCDNPSCCNPIHLFAGTDRDNIADSITKGRFLPSRAKLSEADVAEMRRLYKTGVHWRILGIQFNVDPAHARRIVIGQKWKHLPI